MATTVEYINAAPEQVFAVLSDPYTYAYWVVGCKRIRAVEDRWPEPGSKFHHTIGIGLLATRDDTQVVRIEAPRLLELEAHGWPAGSARVVLRLEGGDRGTRVEMTEYPTQGPARWLASPVLEAAIHTRNTVALRRLARIAEGRL
jgi:uncharacterized protein YndB with AHSA1/START domain